LKDSFVDSFLVLFFEAMLESLAYVKFMPAFRARNTACKMVCCHPARIRRYPGVLQRPKSWGTAYEQIDAECPFCSTDDRLTLFQNSLAVAVRDQYPVCQWHLLVIPKRHTADYFDLGSAEVRARQQLLAKARDLVLKEDSTVLAFNVGINNGAAARQTIMHSGVHLIQRRKGDNPNPRGV
jgi:diadenosine tetraphosphate (Ap4A) HIT family hydrolase